MDILKDPTVNSVLVATIVAILLYVQSYFFEKRRKLGHEEGRDKLIDETASKVVEKLRISQTTIIPGAPKEERVTVPDEAKKP